MERCYSGRGKASKIVRDSTVETTPLTELRRADTDATAVAQFVDLVENVDDIETDFERRLLRELYPARQTHVECLVGMVLLRIGKTAAQSISIQSVNGKSPIIPSI